MIRPFLTVGFKVATAQKGRGTTTLSAPCKESMPRVLASMIDWMQCSPALVPSVLWHPLPATQPADPVFIIDTVKTKDAVSPALVPSVLWLMLSVALPADAVLHTGTVVSRIMLSGA